MTTPEDRVPELIASITGQVSRPAAVHGATSGRLELADGDPVTLSLFPGMLSGFAAASIVLDEHGLMTLRDFCNRVLVERDKQRRIAGAPNHHGGA